MLDRILGQRHDVTLANGGAEALAVIAAGSCFDRLCDISDDAANERDGPVRARAEIAPEQASGFVFLCGGAVTQRAAGVPRRPRRAALRQAFVSAPRAGAMIAERLTERE
jgi:hypothetical protein